MAYVVTEPCIKCVYTDCVEVCPTDCFRVGPNFMAIDPDGCIDCGVCVSECPVNAIVYDDDLPENQRNFIKINLELAGKWPEITKARTALPEASLWNDVKDKLQFLERE
jgi:ferredoxin